MAHSTPAFICDCMLGRLAKNLRMLGFDTLYSRDASLKSLLDSAVRRQRILLTRRTAFLKKKPEQPAAYFFIRSNAPAQQLQEVRTACGLTTADMAPFSVCLRCNARLAAIAKQAALGNVPEYVFTTVAEFSSCPQCGRIYWKGTHYARMAGELEKIMGPQSTAVHQL